jgi:hypothetical protein
VAVICLDFSEATKAEKSLLAASGYFFYDNDFFIKIQKQKFEASSRLSKTSGIVLF